MQEYRANIAKIEKLHQEFLLLGEEQFVAKYGKLDKVRLRVYQRIRARQTAK